MPYCCFLRRGTLPGPWLAEGLAELIATVFSSEGMLAPVLAALKRRAMRWYTIQQTSQDGDKLRLRAHDSMLRDLKAERAGGRWLLFVSFVVGDDCVHYNCVNQSPLFDWLSIENTRMLPKL
jgi:hypothetical protein